jgi:threonine dehydratase
VQVSGLTGAVGIAAFLLSDRMRHLWSRRTCVLLSGGNIATERLARFLTAEPGEVPA